MKRTKKKKKLYAGIPEKGNTRKRHPSLKTTKKEEERKKRKSGRSEQGPFLRDFKKIVGGVSSAKVKGPGQTLNSLNFLEGGGGGCGGVEGGGGGGTVQIFAQREYGNQENEYVANNPLQKWETKKRQKACEASVRVRFASAYQDSIKGTLAGKSGGKKGLIPKRKGEKCELCDLGTQKKTNPGRT